MRSLRFAPIVLATTLVLALFSAPPAHAVWSTIGNAAADSSSRDEEPQTLAPDDQGGMFVSFAYTASNLDSLAVQRLNSDGVKSWGSQGVRVNPGGNGASAALLSPDSSGGVWALWADSRAGALGNYVQRFNAAGVPQLTFGGLRIFTRTVQTLSVATTSAGELLVLFTTAGDSVFVQRVSAAGTKEFSGDGVLLGIDSDPFFAGPNLFADGEGGVVTYPRSPGAATTQMWATRFNAAGTRQWGVNGTQVVALGGITVLRQRAAWDGTSLFCSWEHATVPTGFFDAYPIRAQKLDGAGAVQWAANGVVVHTPVTASPFFETFVPVENNLVADGLGGCYIAWFDPRNYNQPAPNTFLHGDDIYGQRLNSTGVAQWTANGAPIDSTAGGLDGMRSCTDDANGMLLIYTDFLFGDGDEDIELRRVNGTGAPATVWSRLLNSITDSEDPSRERNPVMIPDGAGGAFAAWEDNRNESSSLADVYATRRGASNGLPFVPAITVLAPNGGETLTGLKSTNITWSSTLGSNVKIEFTRNGSFVRQLISASTPDDGVFAWNPPSNATSLKVYVSDAADNVPADSSNATFSLCGTLEENQSYGAINPANDLIEADVNEDGILDAIVAANAGVYVNLGLGTAGVGNGGFGVSALFATASAAGDVVLADFNEDGRLDFAATLSGGGVEVRFGNGTGTVGNGTFGAATTYAAGLTSRGIVAFDANENGILDLAVVNGTSNTVSILLGNGANGIGNGTFAAPADIAVGSNPSRVITGDFNEDGNVDLAVTNTSGPSVSVLIAQAVSGVATGAFAAAVNTTTSTSPLGLCSGDFNEDGILDLAVACTASITAGVNVLLGNGAAGVGNGTFGAATTYNTGATHRDVQVIDLDGDGIADLVATNQAGDAVIAVFGEGAGGVGDGTFTPGGFEGAGNGPSQMRVGDFLEDGIADVITGDASDGNLIILYSHCATALATTLTLTVPNGGQFFQTGTAQTISWTKGAAVLAVDIEVSRDGGTNWELIAQDVQGTSYAWTVTPQVTGTARVRVRDSQLHNRVDGSNANFTIFDTAALNVLLPDGGETLRTMEDQIITWSGNSGGNVRIDLTSNAGATRSTIIASTPNDGQFSWPISNTLEGVGFRIRIADAADGSPVDSSASTFAVCMRLDSVGVVGTGAALVATLSADFNEDGIPDIAGATGAANVGVYLGGGATGVGNGTLVTHVLFPAGPNVNAVACGDVNRDGRLDLVAATDNGAAVLLGAGTGDVGNGSFGAATLFATGGDCGDVELADLNEDGILDIVAANSNNATVAVLIGLGANGVGTGAFAAAMPHAVLGGPSHLVVNDFLEDGILDVVVTCQTGNVFSILLGQGAGGIGNGTLGVATHVATSASPTDIVTCDQNEGGTVDLIILCQSGAIDVFEGNGVGGVGNGTFTLELSNPFAAGTGTDLAVGDFDWNEFPDVFITHASTSQLTVYVNGSGGDLNATGSVSLSQAPGSLAIGDFLEDGVLDVAVAGTSNLTGYSGAACGLTLDAGVASTAPAGGEIWNPGTNQTISWTDGLNVLAVNVELSRDNGRNWETIGKDLVGTSFSWTVTRPATDSALVRVSDSTLPSRNDVTNAVFRIADPLLDAPASIPTTASFSRPVPNPARGAVRFEMALPRDANVSVRAFDVSGRVVATLAEGLFAAGVHSLRWSGSGAERVAPGMYFVRARWEGFDEVRRVVRVE